MKRFIFSFLTVIVALLPVHTCAQSSLFIYPTPPDSMTMFQQRCDYIISRFWNRTNFDQALLYPVEFNKAFGDWIDIMPHASADTVHTAIEDLLKRFEKKGGDKTLAIARLAEAWVYSDTSQLFSEEIMLPFAQAAAKHKKIDKADRAHFAGIEKVLESSMIGATVPDLEFVRPDGSKGILSDICKGSVLLFFCEANDPSSSFVRIRFDADPHTRDLIADGELTVISIYPHKADDKWTEAAKGYPAEWHNVAIADASDYFGRLNPPQLFFLNSERKVLAKNMTQDYLLGAFKYTNENRRKKNE